MSKIKINKNDEHRVLLTELLPYEVPMLFSNEGFYALIKANKHQSFFDKIRSLQAGKKKGYGIPFNYEIRKNAEDTRTLSVMHPLNQYAFIDFYKKYDSLMLHLCDKSPFSLRRVSKVAKYCYSPALVFQEDEHINAEMEVEPEVFDQETKLFKSYFTYHPIDLIYKFYQRNEYQRLEQRFGLLMEFDISRCFYNIYTHTIAWAVKNKEYAKVNSHKESFENSFDRLMQLANHNETNGIIVGPEVSRIFAEIILQQIDINVLNKLDAMHLEDKKRFKLGVHYEIRRYVDDYFIFSNDEKTLDVIQKIYKKELETYKLYINAAKTNKKKAPFITNIGVGKREVECLLDDLYEDLIESINKEVSKEKFEKCKSLKRIGNPYGLAQNFINDFKCIVRRNNITYDFLNKDVVRRIKSIIVEVFKNDDMPKEKELIHGFLLVLLELAFYTYSLSINASSTFKISQIIVLVCKFLEDKEESLRHAIFSKIIREIEFSMMIFQSTAKIHETNVETLNLLIASKKLGQAYLLSEKKILEIFGLNEKDELVGLNYFQITTLLFYFENNASYQNFKKKLEDAVVKKFETASNVFTKAEFSLLFFDFVCCPFVSINSKKKVLKASGYAQADLEEEISKIVSQKSWFMSWDLEINLERVLKKKEWGGSY